MIGINNLFLSLIIYQMRCRFLEESKGLFTFYKEQEKLEDALKSQQPILSKKKLHKLHKYKGKNCSHNKSSQNKTLKTIVNNQEQQQINHKNPIKKYENIKYESLASNNKNKKPILQRTKTQPCQIKALLTSNKNISKKIIIKQPQNYYRSLSPTTSDLLKNYSPKNEQKNHRPGKQQTNQALKLKIGQKFKSLQIKKKGGLISNLQSVNVNDKMFFKDASSISPLQYRKNTYLLLKDSTKLPNIKQQINQSQNLQKVLVKAVKNTPLKRKDFKANYQNVQRRELFRFNLLAQLTQQKYLMQHGQTSLINLNNSYKFQQTSSQQWQIKKKLIKSRLGIQL